MFCAIPLWFHDAFSPPSPLPHQRGHARKDVKVALPECIIRLSSWRRLWKYQYLYPWIYHSYLWLCCSILSCARFILYLQVKIKKIFISQHVPLWGEPRLYMFAVDTLCYIDCYGINEAPA